MYVCIFIFVCLWIIVYTSYIILVHFFLFMYSFYPLFYLSLLLTLFPLGPFLVASIFLPSLSFQYYFPVSMSVWDLHAKVFWQLVWLPKTLHSHSLTRRLTYAMLYQWLVGISLGSIWSLHVAIFSFSHSGHETWLAFCTPICPQTPIKGVREMERHLTQCNLPYPHSHLTPHSFIFVPTSVSLYQMLPKDRLREERVET